MSLDNTNVIEQLKNILMPYISQKQKELHKSNNQFVHYTSAENAMSIIKSKRLWMRSPKCMNDYMEIEHGYQQLDKFFRSEKNKKYFTQIMNSITENASEIILDRFSEWWKKIENDIYIASISVHHLSEDKHGRLSMWRAYGEQQAKAALVLNNPPEPIEELKLILSPVAYLTYDDLEKELLSIIDNVKSNVEFLKTLEPDSVLNHIVSSLIVLAVCLKHPGFHEEQEWRVIYLPEVDRQTNNLIEKSVESISGVPQIVYKLILDDNQELGVNNLSIPSIVDKVIIGPTQYPWALFNAFDIALSKAGVNNTSERIVFSEIPLRT